MKRSNNWRFRITNECNALCSFCHGEGFNMSSEKKYISPEYFKSVLGQVSSKDNISITGGEPLLHPLVCDFLNWCFEKTKGKVHLNTNGILLDERIDELQNTELKDIHVNLATLNTSTYEQIYGIKFQDSFIEGLRSAKNKGFNITINSVVIKDDVDNIKSLIDFCSNNLFNLCFIEPYRLHADLKGSQDFQIFVGEILCSKNFVEFERSPSRVVYKKGELITTVAAPCSPAQIPENIDADAYVVLEDQSIRRFNKNTQYIYD